MRNAWIQYLNDLENQSWKIQVNFFQVHENSVLSILLKLSNIGSIYLHNFVFYGKEELDIINPHYEASKKCFFHRNNFKF